MNNTPANTEGIEEITRTEAAQLLGVSVTSVRQYPIPFRQYKPKSKAMYRRSDVLAFKQSSMHMGAS